MYSKQDVFVGEFDGLVTTEYLMKEGVPFSRIRKMVADGDLIRVERGIYVASDSMDDEWQILQTRYSKGIFSGYTAMYLQNMCDEIPVNFYMTFPHGYNTKSLANSTYPVVASYTIPKLYELGVIEVKTPYGNRVRTYDRERTLCDIVRGDGIDRDVTKQAMKNYIQDGPDLVKLMDYAKILRVTPKIHHYMDVMT